VSPTVSPTQQIWPDPSQSSRHELPAIWPILASI